MNSLDIGLAFIEGLALIISPCILPVLPLILSTGATGGRARPYGIITGFIFAFSAFVLLSRQIITALHIEPDVIRNVSLVLLFALGLVMLSDRLSKIFSAATQGLADIGATAGQNAKGGFLSGIPIGALIGLVWTPCAGPILAAVLVQVIRQQTDLQGVLVTLAFAVGASIPMLAITLMGRQLLGKMKFVTANTEKLRKIFGVLIILSVIVMAFGANAFNLINKQNSVSTGAVTELKNSITPYAAPEFTGIAEWLNSKPLTMAQLRGKVVLVDFWTYSCINCIRTLPYITSWDAKYREKGLVIIGVHAPEFEFEKKVENIQSALAKYGIKYPVAVDNNLATWGAFHNQYWPAHYLINQNGQVVYTHFGEGHYDVTENNIRFLLGLKDAVTVEQKNEFAANQTPETYLGSRRGGEAHDYWSINDQWNIAPEKITATADDATLKLHFTAKKVFLVMGTENGQPVVVKLKLNGADLLPVTINGHQLYQLLEQESAKPGDLEITAGAGAEFYAFTFGS